VFLQNGIKNFLLNPYTTNFFYSLMSLELNESYLSPVLLFPQFVLIVYLVSLFSIFLFGFFTASNNDENLIDHDFLITSLLVESEEEFGSLDDMIIAGILFFYVFG
jgi:threonine/homoserine/homoserine lactone efflux protein